MGARLKITQKRRIVGHTESGDGLSVKIQSADVKKVLGSVHNMNI